MKHVMIIGLAIVLAGLVGNATRMLIATETVDWEVGDSQGHGPDRGSLEWQRALKGQAKRAGIGYGVVTFALGTGLGYVGLYTHQKNKEAKQLEQS